LLRSSRLSAVSSLPKDFYYCAPSFSTSTTRSVLAAAEPASSSVIDGEEGNKLESKKKLDKKKELPLMLAEFFYHEWNWGKTELAPSRRPGRQWTADELRLKSNSDLHKLWYVLLKERNMLLTMQHACKSRLRFFPNPERLDRVKESMDNIEEVVHERNDAFLQLETGQGASPPERTITSFAGFTYKETAREHYAPAEETGKKDYEVPYLDDDAYLMQKLWAEKRQMREQIEAHDAWINAQFDENEIKNLKLRRARRKHYNRLDHLPPIAWPINHQQQQLVEGGENISNDECGGARSGIEEKQQSNKL